MQADEAFDLAVVGGGPAGLAHAFWRLRQQPDLRVRVFEAAPRLGGWVRTEHVDGYQLELGPQGFRPEPSTAEFLAATGLAQHVIPCAPSAKRRFLVKNGRPHELPSGLFGVLTSPLLPISAKLRLPFEPRVKSRSEHEESVAAFVQRRFGRHAAPFAEAMMHGIFAGDAHQLEVASTLPVAVEIEREHGSVLRGMGARRRQRTGPPPPVVCTFAQGMQQSVDALAAALGERTHVGTQVTSVARAADRYRLAFGGDERHAFAREVCVTTPPAATASMLRGLDAELATEMTSIPTVNVASTYLGFPATAVPDTVDGFGALRPQAEPGPVLGAIFSSRVFPQQAPPGHVLFRVMSGGFRHPDEVDRSDDELLAQAAGFLRNLFGIRGEPTLGFTSRARNSIPQYVRGHAERMHRIQQRLAHHDGLTLRGASYRKVSVVGQWTVEGSQP